MRVDLIIQPHLPAEEFAALGELAESYGISGVWVSNHLDGRDPFVQWSEIISEFSCFRWARHPRRGCTESARR